MLERMGLVTTEVGTDARSRTIRLSRKGISAFKRAVPLWSAVQSELKERLGLDGRAKLDQMLQTLTKPVEVK